MKKPNQLRAALERALPFFRANPDKLQLFTDGGQIIATGAQSLSFEYRYRLNLIVTDYANDLATLIAPILAYLRTAQPELFENPQRRENGIKFETDFNNNNTLDVSIEIQLTERVIAKTQADRLTLDYAPEPTWNELPERLRVYWQNDEQPIFDSQLLTKS